ncbi:MAG: hypothetical protein C0511_17505 [Hyphomicrobium sp.]|nr:hypothetical protein [Hyphomicrobium sp.]
MKRALACTLLLCLASAQTSHAKEAKNASPQPHQTGEMTMMNDENAVQAAVDRMTSAFEKNDLDAVISSYEPGAAVVFEPGQPVTDEQQLRQMFGGMAAANPVFTYSGHEVVVSGDTAVHIAPWQMVAHTPDGQEIRQSGLSVAVLRRQADGSWKMVIDNPHGARLLTQGN